MTGNNPVVPETIWTLENAKNGMITVKSLHSAYNPEREAFNAVNQKEVFEKSTVVFYGFGLGYHVIEFAKLCSQCKNNPPRLVLVEPELSYFFASMSVLDWTPVFNLQNLIIAVGAPAESVLPLVENNSSVNILPLDDGLYDQLQQLSRFY